MADDETEIPADVRDILARLPREMRRRVVADYETHYAPFLAMLAGWKGAVQQHYLEAEKSSVARLEEQFFPLGDWKFPAQTLAVPQRPPARTSDITEGLAFTDSAGSPWMACGEGWLQPTALREASVQWAGGDCLVILDIDQTEAEPVETILERGQLAFFGVPEEALDALSRASWWVLVPGDVFRPASWTRYDGYMAFEREMQTARMNQRQLDLWLPPFHPYGRKMARLGRGRGDVSPHPALAGQRLDRGLASGFRLVGVISAPPGQAAAALRGMGARRPGPAWVSLNAVPVVQTGLSDNIFYPPFPRVGQEHALRMTGVPDIFAATVRHDGLDVPSTLVRLPSQDPLATEMDVQVQFPQAQTGVTQVKIYHGSWGRGRMGMLDTPTSLEKAPLRFSIPYLALGGATAGGPADRAEWVRTAWYHSVLRPPLLTEGDLWEIIRQRQGDLGEMLRFRSAVREIVHDPETDGIHWRSYLWPSLLARASAFEGEGIPAPDAVPLIQSLRITFERAAPAEVPDFLLADMANYLASILSQYFVLSTFRIEGTSGTMTRDDMPRDDMAPGGAVVFPQLSGLNWPSYLLEAWRTLYALGVPEENLRLLPELGHFAVPEVSTQDPPGPSYDPLGERLTVHYVEPSEVRPRLTVSVRADTLDYFVPEGETGQERRVTHTVGRLAHFVPPLLAGLPGAPPPPRPHSPLEDLTQQVCAFYPELMRTPTPEERVMMEAGADDILAVLAETDAARLPRLIRQATRRAADPDLRASCRLAWPRMADKLTALGVEGFAGRARPAALETLKRWALLLYGALPEMAEEDSGWTEMTPAEAEEQRALLRALLTALSYEVARERERIVRELTEIITTEALLATAVIDSLSGIGWIHGLISDQRAAGTERLDGWFLSVTGGRNSRTLLASRLEEWAEGGGVLGVGDAAGRGDALDLGALDETERMQLWSLAAWRREAADPFVLLETAAQRLIHPDFIVHRRRYVPAFSRPATLLAQLGSTAVLGGAALLQYPGVTLEMPLSDEDEGAEKARATLALLLRLFLPVCCRVEVLWRESAARLDRPSYLHHESGSGARLGGGSVAGGAPAGDPIAL